MSGALLGTTPITGIKLGTTDITKVYLGSTLVWSKTNLRDDFNRANATGLGSDWTDHGSATSPYLASVVNNAARLNIPDGLISVSTKVSEWRYNVAQHPGNDGHIECRLGTRGDDDVAFKSKLFRRVSNAAVTHGVGLQFDAYTARIVRRVSGTDTVMLTLGGIESGDIWRLEQVGNLHSAYRNGEYKGEWNDSGASASSGAGFRSMAVSLMGNKDFLGPRHFSAAFDYVECA